MKPRVDDFAAFGVTPIAGKRFAVTFHGKRYLGPTYATRPAALRAMQRARRMRTSS